jgi:hypothetical protein
MSVQTRLVLSTLCVFNAIVIALLGALAVGWVDRPAGPIAAGALWLCSGLLIGLSRHLRAASEWRWPDDAPGPGDTGPYVP